MHGIICLGTISLSSPLDFVPEYQRICKSYGILPHPAIAASSYSSGAGGNNSHEHHTGDGDHMGTNGIESAASSGENMPSATPSLARNNHSQSGYPSAKTPPGGALVCTSDDNGANVDTLSIQHWKVDFATIFVLEMMAHTRSLTTLVLTDCGLSGKAIQTLGQLLEDSFIQKLTVEFNPLGLDKATGARPPPPLLVGPELASLADPQEGIVIASDGTQPAHGNTTNSGTLETTSGDDDDCPFAWLIPVPTVTMPSGPPGLALERHDSSMTSPSSGQAGNAGGTGASSTGSDANEPASESSNATSSATTGGSNLSLANLNLAPSGPTTVASSSMLQVLSLRGNGLTSKDISRIAARLKKNTTLQSLNLSLNNITDAGCTELADAIANNKSLVVLNLSENKIGARGARMLVAATVPCDADRPQELLSGIQQPSSSSSSSSGSASTSHQPNVVAAPAPNQPGSNAGAKGGAKKDQLGNTALRVARTFKPYNSTLKVLNLAGNPLGAPPSDAEPAGERDNAQNSSASPVWFPLALAACLEAAGRQDVADLLALKYCALAARPYLPFPANLPLPSPRNIPLNGSYCHDVELPAFIAEVLNNVRDSAWSLAARMAASTATSLTTVETPVGDLSFAALIPRLLGIESAPSIPGSSPALGLNTSLGIGIPGLGFAPTQASSTVGTNPASGGGATVGHGTSGSTSSTVSAVSGAAAAIVAAAHSAAAASAAAAAAATATSGPSSLIPLLFGFPSLTGFSAGGINLQSAALTGPGASILSQLTTLAGATNPNMGVMSTGAGARGKQPVNPSSAVAGARPSTSAGSGSSNAGQAGSSSGTHAQGASTASVSPPDANLVQVLGETVRNLHSALVEEIIKKLSDAQLIPTPGKPALVNPQLALTLVNYSMPHACLAGFRESENAQATPQKSKIERIILTHTALPDWARKLIRQVPEVVIE